VALDTRGKKNGVPPGIREIEPAGGVESWPGAFPLTRVLPL